MRKLLILLVLFFTLNSAAQTRKYYADVWIYENYNLIVGLLDKSLFGTKIFLDIDLKHYGFLADKDSVSMSFISQMQAVNYLADMGWSIIGVPDKDLPFVFRFPERTKHFDDMTHFIMCKEATSIEEATKDLIMDTNIDKTIGPPKKRVKKEVKDGKTYYKFNKERN